ncbi:hypothetical protein OIU78_021236 [Salix suchowensis]|nr:hypothetical protein OIU78_021236 [Salix suchowensis]
MAPEVILQTGHSFSADIWSVGCTVIEMATGKPPWSEQYQEVAALFYVGSTKSHPEIPKHLIPEAKDFLLKCLHREPNMRPDASQLLQHPFVTGEIGISDHVTHSPVMELSGILLQSYTTSPETIQMPSSYDTMDVCNLGSLSCSMDPKKLSESNGALETQNSDDNMCQIDNDFSTSQVKLGSLLTSNDFKKSSDPKCELSGDWRGTKMFHLYCGASLSEDNDALTESKIRAFLAEKALELRKLQTPLYEEFYNNLNAPSSSSFGGSSRDETPPNYLILPPKSRSPNQIPVGSPSTSTDAVSTGSHGSNKRASNFGNASNQASEDNSYPRSSDRKGLVLDDQPETFNPSVRQRKWKEELDQELESKREMIRHAGTGSKTLSPRDRASGRQRERTRFASPSK